ncbi:hypothetical protein B0A48_13298 [Cryoendolithus antarcticus]|uniref:Uncharacterized protein n=1 Tax=Cryoendolithus antarcticus TaxID=1507870 RepID=A0A1V8SPG1_9PEZI|nr:hypothetical protein B0A48_13298 [Cryoendolithus antarcticus]
MASPTSPVKPSPTSSTKPNRLPAPSLFVGPPSRNASQLSVLRSAPEPKPPLNRHKSTLSRSYAPGSPVEHNHVSPRRDSEKSVDLRWREMQNTLNEVELTAQSTTHIFGESHAKALDDLRAAQVELARAWGRGSEEANASTAAAEPANHSRFNAADKLAEERRTRVRGDTETSVSTVLSDESVRSDETARGGISQLEEDTAEDIKRASERRGQNEAYFKMVERSVKDVVEKLGVVASAMKNVEGESRSLWSGSGSGRSSGE